MKKQASFSREGFLNENYHYFHLKDTAGQEKSFHFHEFDKIVILLAGKVDYTVESTVYSLPPRSVLLVPHHAIHRADIDVTVPYERIILYLDSLFFERSMPSAGLMHCFHSADRTGQYLLLPTRKQAQDLEGFLQAYEAARTDEEYGSEAMRDTLIMQFLIAVNRISAAGPAVQGSDKHFDEKIRSTLSFINENLAGDLSVDVLSERVFLSRYHFMRLFKQQTGSPVHAYIRQKRLLYAARMIREGMPAGQAATEAGFNDYSVFSRAFRESFGIRPGDLKK